MSTPMPNIRQDWEKRLLPLVTILPYALLAVLAAFTAILKRSDGRSLLIDLALCALAAAWMFGMFTVHPAWRERPRVMALFVGVLILIIYVLVLRDPWFGVFSIAAYQYAFRLFSWPWELVAVAGVAFVAGTAQATGIPKTTVSGLAISAAVILANIVPMCGVAWLGWNGERLHHQREQALRDVNEANQRLEATLVENAGLHEQLLSQARAAGVLDERARMAREIHDTLAQGLTGIITQLQAAEQAVEDPAGWRRHFEAATRLARESLTEARRSVDALRPQPLETARLSEALANVAEHATALHGLPIVVTTTGTVRPIPPDVEVALLRTAQEALANSTKHAQANRVGVTLSYMEDEISLDVRDDGTGFVESETGPGGFGLVSMRQRIEGLSGRLHIESEPGSGTAISACVPARPEAALR